VRGDSCVSRAFVALATSFVEPEPPSIVLRPLSQHSGKGAALAGGGWNPAGVEAIYAAATLSLADLEVLVRFAVLPRDFVPTEPLHITVGRRLVEG